MAIWNLENFITRLDNWGLIDVLLPFLLIFAILYAILDKAKIFGNDKKNINTVVSLVISLLVVVPHVTRSYPPNWDVVEIMNRALPSLVLVVIAIVMLLILIGVFGGQASWTKGSLASWIFIVSLIIVIWAFGAASGRIPGWDWLRFRFGEDTLALIVIILVFAIIIAYVTSGDKGAKQANNLTSGFKNIGDFFSGGR